MGNRFISSAGVGKSCVLPIRVPNPSPTLDKYLASMGPGILSSIGVGVWRKAPEAFPQHCTGYISVCESMPAGPIVRCCYQYFLESLLSARLTVRSGIAEWLVTIVGCTPKGSYGNTAF